MERKRINGGRLRSAEYDERDGVLEIEFLDYSVKRFQSVPIEVWRRLLSAPNPATYYEDRIEEEYPAETAAHRVDDSARAQLDSLFGPPPAPDGADPSGPTGRG